VRACIDQDLAANFCMLPRLDVGAEPIMNAKAFAVSGIWVRTRFQQERNARSAPDVPHLEIEVACIHERWLWYVGAAWSVW